jgi:hypothetical protein
MVVDPLVQERFQLFLECLHLCTLRNQQSRSAPNVRHRPNLVLPKLFPGVTQQIAHLPVNQEAHYRGLKLLRPNARVQPADLLYGALPESDTVEVS